MTRTRALRSIVPLVTWQPAMTPTLPTLNSARMTARRVRTETGIGQLHVSVSSVAVELAQKIFSDLAGHSALVIGAASIAHLVLYCGANRQEACRNWSNVTTPT